MKPYSLDLRARVLEALDAGQSSPQVAIRFDVSEAFVRKLRIRRATHGHFESFSPSGRPRMLDEKDEERLCRLALKYADATIPELRALSVKELGLAMSITTVGRRLRGMGMTRKKGPSGRQKWTAPASTRNVSANSVEERRP